MNTSTPDPAAAIAEALARLRGRRRGPGGTGWQGRPGHPHESERGDRPHGRHSTPPWQDFLQRGQGDPRGRGERWWADDHGRTGAPAIVRMLEAIAKSPEPPNVSSIGEAIGVDQPRASRLVQQGVARGLLLREADPEDARRTRIALTDRGKQFTRGLHHDRSESLRTALEGFTAQERADLARLLNKLADNWPG